MTATDELRKLLDERGVKHEDKHTELVPEVSEWDSTWWHGIAGMEFHAVGDETCGREGCVYVNGTYLTPEQAIAATLGSDNEYEAKMDALLCRLTNGKWSKSRAYSLDFMVSCVDEEYEELYEKERAELGNGTCKLEETESYPSECGMVHVLECSNCGRECEHVNGDYEHCPHCLARNELF